MSETAFLAAWSIGGRRRRPGCHVAKLLSERGAATPLPRHPERVITPH